MSIAYILHDVLPKAYELLPASMASTRANVMLLAIGLQESNLEYRRQIGGPARGLWQFEKGGGVKGVLTHKASKNIALDVCQALDIVPDADACYLALAENDILAACFARLLLFTDPKPLPDVNDTGGAWDYYNRIWRPGKPHPLRWHACHEKAREAVKGLL